MPVPAKKPPRLVMYRGAAYELVETPPREVIFRGAKYVLAEDYDPNADPTDKPKKFTRDQLKKVTTAVPGVVFANNFYPGIKAMMDPLVRLGSILDEQYRKGLWQAKGGLKLIIDAGYDARLLDLIQRNGPEYFIERLDRFVTALAKVDATATVISKTVEAARKEVLETPEFKDLLGGSQAVSNYNEMYNSALADLNDMRPDMNFVIKTKNIAKDAADTAKSKVEDTVSKAEKDSDED